MPCQDTWNLDITIADFILPRLQEFKKVSDSFPHDLSSVEEWHDILDKMIAAFTLISNKFKHPLEFYESRAETIDCGLDLFRKYYYDLWW